MSERICDKVAADVRHGSLVFIDLNTKTNFRKSKLPRLHTVSMLLDSDSNTDSPKDTITRMTKQLSRDIDWINHEKERLRSLFISEKVKKSHAESIDNEKQHRPKLKPPKPHA